MIELLRLPKNFLLILTLIFFNSIGGVIPIFATISLKELGFKVEDVGFCVGVFGLGGFIGGYIGGQLSDFILPRKVVSYSILGSAISSIFLGFLSDVVSIATCMFFVGLFSNSFRPSGILVMFEKTNRVSKSTALSLRRVVLNFGFSIFSVVFGFVLQREHQFTFTIIGCLFLFNFLLSLFLKGNGFVSEDSQGKLEGGGSRSILSFYILNILLFLGIVVLEQYKTTYVMFLQDYTKLKVFEVSLLFTFHGVLILIFQIPLGAMCDKAKPEIVCFLGSILLAIGIGLTFLVKSFMFGIVLCIFWTFSEMILFPTMLPYILNKSVYKKGKTLGVYQAFFSLGVLVSPIFGSFFYAINPTLLWVLCFILCIICGVIFLILYKIYEKTSRFI
jgi:predicted MFS family arabinose efflux permease